MRMLGPSGNPHAANLVAVLEYLQRAERITLELRVDRRDRA